MWHPCQPQLTGAAGLWELWLQEPVIKPTQVPFWKGRRGGKGELQSCSGRSSQSFLVCQVFSAFSGEMLLRTGVTVHEEQTISHSWQDSCVSALSSLQCQGKLSFLGKMEKYFWWVGCKIQWNPKSLKKRCLEFFWRYWKNIYELSGRKQLRAWGMTTNWGQNNYFKYTKLGFFSDGCLYTSNFWLQLK